MLDFLISRCEAAGFTAQECSSDSPLNVASYETIYAVGDGGLLIYAGNYDSEERPVGAYLIGFDAFRWALKEIGLKVPARFKGERKHP